MSARLSDSCLGLNREIKQEKQAQFSSELHTARKALKKKFAELQHDRAESAHSLEQQYLPITNTLKELVASANKGKGETVMKKMKQRRTDVIPGSEIEYSQEPSTEDDENVQDPSDTEIFECKGEGWTPPARSPGPFMSTPISHPSSFLRAPQKMTLMQRIKKDTKKLDASHKDDIDESIEPVHSLIKSTPEAQKMTQDFIRRWPSFAKVYWTYLTTGNWEGGDGQQLDKYYGPTVNRQGVNLGAARVAFDDDFMYVNGKPYHATPGLYELIFLKKPVNFDQQDFENYTEIVKRSRVAHHGYDLHRPLNRFGGEKYTSIISLMYPKKRKNNNVGVKHDVGSKKGSGVTNLFTHFRGFDANISPDWISTEDNPNLLVEKLELSLGSFDAGNSRLQSTANKIIDRLEELGYIY
ncbi:hypothetical protein GE061_009287 [Apolygus lucorum]|uniref:DUF8207 domain-containing protein n=1 Tax=Apolygus lucorum TaxID=248454 RepID=A0A6A4IPI3_APOLU|nr:hypothetical protein GE061_009287 [Apolygus lucorum]